MEYTYNYKTIQLVAAISSIIPELDIDPASEHLSWYRPRDLTLPVVFVDCDARTIAIEPTCITPAQYFGVHGAASCYEYKVIEQ